MGLIPPTTSKVFEIGGSSGALAREFKRNNDQVDLIGVEIDSSYAELARRHCDKDLVADIDVCCDDWFYSHRDRDCWVFADVLEHLKILGGGVK